MFKKAIVFVAFYLCQTHVAMAAACNPSSQICVDQTCATFGTSTMDKDGKNIIACLKNDAESLVWKSMTSAAPDLGKLECVSASSNGAYNGTGPVAYCPAGYIITGVTCQPATNGDITAIAASVEGNYANCSGYSSTGTVRIGAICCRIK